jgi:hypothetical protein
MGCEGRVITILDCGFWIAELKENEEYWNNGVLE